MSKVIQIRCTSDPKEWPALLDQAQAAITAGADVNHEPEEECRCPLTDAILTKSHALVHLLLDNGADVNKKLKSLDTPLIHACKIKSCPEEIITLLLDRGADVNADNEPEGDDATWTDTRGTALVYAMKNRRRNICKLLLDRGAAVDLLGVRSMFALMCRGGYVPIVRLLLLYNYPVNELCQYLDNAMVLFKHVHQQTPLQVSIREKGDTTVARLLLEHGADPNLVLEPHKDITFPPDMNSAMWKAFNLRRYDVVELLLSHGAWVHDLQQHDRPGLSVPSKIIETMYDQMNLQVVAITDEEKVGLQEVLWTTSNLIETVLSYCTTIDEDFTLALTICINKFGDIPQLIRLRRSVNWIRRKAFVCTLHAAGLLGLTGKIQPVREQAAAAQTCGREKKRKRGEETSRAADPIDKTGPRPRVEEVFLSLKREIVSFL